MKTNEFSDFIERYNAGEMDAREKIWFEKEIEGNHELRMEVLLRRKTDLLLKDKDILSLRNKLSVIEDRRKVKEQVPVYRRMHYFRYAAIFAGMVLLGSIFVSQNRDLSNDQIIDRFYKTYEFASSPRSGAISGDKYFEEAVKYYNDKDFRTAAVFFKKVLNQNMAESKPLEMRSRFLYGVSSFEVKDYPEAKSSFNEVIENRDNYFIEDANWFLAMCYVETGENGLAREQLQRIKESSSRYKGEARRVLRRLRQ